MNFGRIGASEQRAIDQTVNGQSTIQGGAFGNGRIILDSRPRIGLALLGVPPSVGPIAQQRGQHAVLKTCCPESCRLMTITQATLRSMLRQPARRRHAATAVHSCCPVKSCVIKGRCSVRIALLWKGQS